MGNPIVLSGNKKALLEGRPLLLMTRDIAHSARTKFMTRILVRVGLLMAKLPCIVSTLLKAIALGFLLGDLQKRESEK